MVKNTLAQRAVADLELPDIAGFFTGPTGLVIGRDDAIAAAKVLTDFAREFDNKPAVKLGVVDRKEVGPEQVKQLAELPPEGGPAGAARRRASGSRCRASSGGMQQPHGRASPGLWTAAPAARDRRILTEREWSKAAPPR